MLLLLKIITNSNFLLFLNNMKLLIVIIPKYIVSRTIFNNNISISTISTTYKN